MTLAHGLSEGAHWIGLVPVWWLGWLRLRGQGRDAGWWWIAIAFGISWVADTAVDLGAPAWLASAVYPVSQASLIGAALLNRDDAVLFTLVLLVVGVSSVSFAGVGRPELFLSTVASLGVAGIAREYTALGRVRWALLVTFGAGWLMWMAYATDPGWLTYLFYQGSRLVGTALFCWAATEPKPLFTLHSTPLATRAGR